MPRCRLTQFAKPTHIPTTLDHLQLRRSQPKNFHCICPFGKISFILAAEKPREICGPISVTCLRRRNGSLPQPSLLTRPDLCRTRTEKPCDYKYFGAIPIKHKVSEQTIHYTAMAKGSSKHSLTVTSPNSPRLFPRHSKLLLFYPANELLLIEGYGQPYGSDDRSSHPEQFYPCNGLQETCCTI
jgi:hypothetical protein